MKLRHLYIAIGLLITLSRPCLGEEYVLASKNLSIFSDFVINKYANLEHPELRSNIVKRNVDVISICRDNKESPWILKVLLKGQLSWTIYGNNGLGLASVPVSGDCTCICEYITRSGHFAQVGLLLDAESNEDATAAIGIILNRISLIESKDKLRAEKEKSFVSFVAASERFSGVLAAKPLEDKYYTDLFSENKSKIVVHYSNSSFQEPLTIGPKAVEGNDLYLWLKEKPVRSSDELLQVSVGGKQFIQIRKDQAICLVPIIELKLGQNLRDYCIEWIEQWNRKPFRFTAFQRIN